MKEKGAVCEFVRVGFAKRHGSAKPHSGQLTRIERLLPWGVLQSAANRKKHLTEHNCRSIQSIHRYIDTSIIGHLCPNENLILYLPLRFRFCFRWLMATSMDMPSCGRSRSRLVAAMPWDGYVV
jgi:hypothetical protein